MASQVGYVAYIDEAGDFGLNNIAPYDLNGASEWFVISAAVIRKPNEEDLIKWIASIRTEAKSTQSKALHFRTLSDRQKLIVCKRCAELPVRYFVVISNKLNMRRHKNDAAKGVSNHKHWFYMWMTRLLLERVTDFCQEQNIKQGNASHTLELIFSERKDFRQNEFTDYFTRLWLQGKSPFLNKRVIDWTVFDFENVHFLPADSRAGLQLADVAASAFYQAINITPQGACCAEYAKLLKARVHGTPRDGKIDCGFTVWPKTQLKINEQQKDVFRFYHYPEKFL